MKKFDIEQAKAGVPVCTRDGREATILCFDHDDRDGDYPIVAKVSVEEGYDAITKFRPDGRVGGSFARDGESVCDLMMAVEPTYRSFRSAEEVMEAIKEYGDWVKSSDGTFLKLKWVFPSGGIGVMGVEENYSPEGAIRDYTFADGTPFGKLED